MKPETRNTQEEPGKARPADGPLLAWPAPKDLRFGLLLCLAFFFFFESAYIATNYVTGLHRFRMHVHSGAELSIPFVPAMAVVYISLNLMLALTPFVLRTWRDITPLCVVMTLETLICALFFLLFPVELGYAPQVEPGKWGMFCGWVSAVSLKYNNMPSLHVAFAFTAAMAFGARCGALGRRLFLLWAGLIAASTVLIHEHHVADVVAGIALAVAMGGVYRWSAAGPRLEALRLELMCLAEFRHFVLRHRRYLFTLIVIYRYSLGRWRQTRIVRAGYCLTQHVDDVLDGDRRVSSDPEAYVNELLRQIADDDYDEASFVSSLTRYVVTTLRGYGKGSDSADQDLLCLFDLLLFDHRRRKDRLLLASDELREHHRRTFFYSLNLTLLVCGSELRAEDAGELISALAWCSVMRDLEEDLNKGLINVPVTVLDQAAKQGAATLEYDQLISTPAVRNWIRAEYVRGLAATEQCAARLEFMKSRAGVRVLALFLRAIRLYARKYARENRDILGAHDVPALQEVRRDEPC
jgi:membrane-associated phospholipid phosphatase